MQFQDELAAGVVLVRPALQSPDYVTGVSGWAVKIDGSAEFSDVVLRGDGVGDTIIIGPATGSQVTIGFSGTSSYVRFPMNSPKENFISQINAAVFNSGAANESLSLQLRGPSVDDATDRLELLLSSQNNDGSSQANMILRLAGGSSGNLMTVDKNLGWEFLRHVIVEPTSTGGNALTVDAPVGMAGDLLVLAVNSAIKFNADSTGTLQTYADNTFGTYVPGIVGIGAATFSIQTGWWVRIGKMIFFAAYFVVNGAGTTANTVMIDGPQSVDRTTRQTVGINLQGLTVGSGSGQMVSLTGGSGAAFDRTFTSTGTIVQGQHLAAGAVLTATGWYREA